MYGDRPNEEAEKRSLYIALKQNIPGKGGRITANQYDDSSCKATTRSGILIQTSCKKKKKE